MSSWWWKWFVCFFSYLPALRWKDKRSIDKTKKKNNDDKSISLFSLFLFRKRQSKTSCQFELIEEFGFSSCLFRRKSLEKFICQRSNLSIDANKEKKMFCWRYIGDIKMLILTRRDRLNTCVYFLRSIEWRIVVFLFSFGFWRSLQRKEKKTQHDTLFNEQKRKKGVPNLRKSTAK